MDAPSKLFILMMLLALLFGWAVIKLTPEYDRDKILQSNDQNHYYSTVK